MKANSPKSGSAGELPADKIIQLSLAPSCDFIYILAAFA
jgi:hypothetical protein